MTEPVITGKMNKESLHAALQAPNLARLATADLTTCQPHVVPVWFGWDGDSLWIHSYSNTRKIRELRANPNCSVVIDTVGKDGTSWGVLMEGQAELIREPKDWLQQQITWVYLKYLGPEGVLAPDPQEWIHDPHSILVKLTPKKIMTW